jgi:signal transduction histidine kinase
LGFYRLGNADGPFLIHDARGKTTICLHPRNQQVEFHIADSGIGISHEERLPIFERFLQGQ